MEINKNMTRELSGYAGFYISAVNTVVSQRPSVPNISLVITAVKNAAEDGPEEFEKGIYQL